MHKFQVYSLISLNKSTCHQDTECFITPEHPLVLLPTQWLHRSNNCSDFYHYGLIFLIRDTIMTISNV